MVTQKSEEALAEEQMGKIEQLKKDYISTFSSEAGKKVLKDLERRCFTNKTTFPQNATALNLALNEGMRFVVVYIKNMINMNVELLKELTQRGE